MAVHVERQHLRRCKPHPRNLCDRVWQYVIPPASSCTSALVSLSGRPLIILQLCRSHLAQVQVCWFACPISHQTRRRLLLCTCESAHASPSFICLFRHNSFDSLRNSQLITCFRPLIPGWRSCAPFLSVFGCRGGVQEDDDRRGHQRLIR
jgi:hypothetical protein